MMPKASSTFHARGLVDASIVNLRLIRSLEAALDAACAHKKILWGYKTRSAANAHTYVATFGGKIEDQDNESGGYFFSRLVWLETHCHLPASRIQVSVKRPMWSYDLPW